MEIKIKLINQLHCNLKKRITNSNIEIIENADHEVNIDNPQKLGIILNKFFKEGNEYEKM